MTDTQIRFDVYDIQTGEREIEIRNVSLEDLKEIVEENEETITDLRNLNIGETLKVDTEYEYERIR